MNELNIGRCILRKRKKNCAGTACTSKASVSKWETGKTFPPLFCGVHIQNNQ
ncbi:UNVERIFIED_ORG: hypothetical protein ABRZ91_001251 [Heyndrickxia coagulans]